ncbi:MAG: N-acetyl-gamma-glutamyl-phosphate reductase [Pseudomonadota bacterium]
MATKIYVDGEHGTTGLQILNRLQGRKDITLLSMPHEERRNPDKRRELLREADIAILCLPDDASREAAQMVADTDTRLIDASTAHRTNPDWVYGFKELDPDHSAKIAAAKYVSNPGCYPTGAIALLRPLVKAGVLPQDAPVTINAVSGYTGGGKGLIAQMENADAPDAITAPLFAYALALTHKHQPEIEKYSGLTTTPLFTPAVGNFPQGMVVQAPFHVRQLNGASRADVHKTLSDYYNSDHVRVVPMAESDALPRIDATTMANTDTMDLHVFGNDKHINLIAVLDNLGKGASGACVQAMDLMIGANPAP